MATAVQTRPDVREDRTPVSNIRVAADGKFLRAIGTAGVPKAGPYDPNHMNNPNGIAIDGNEHLWVAETDFQPKRVSVWSYGWGFGQDGPRHRHDRDAVTVWVVDGTPHAAFVPAGTVHSEEQLGVISSATIFEIK